MRIANYRKIKYSTKEYKRESKKGRKEGRKAGRKKGRMGLRGHFSSSYMN